MKEEDAPPEEQGQHEDFDDGHDQDDEPALERLQSVGSVASLRKVDVAAAEVGPGVGVAGLQGAEPVAVEIARLVGLLADGEAVEAFDGRVVDERADREFTRNSRRGRAG